MTNPTPTAPALSVDDLLPALASAEKPEAIALVLMRAVMKAERDTKPSTSYLLDLNAECLDTVYGERAGARGNGSKVLGGLSPEARLAMAAGSGEFERRYSSGIFQHR
jgi:hypothetical protein